MRGAEATPWAAKPSARPVQSARLPDSLPCGYSLGTDPDLVALLREDGSTVAFFSAAGALWEETVRPAREDRRVSR